MELNYDYDYDYDYFPEQLLLLHNDLKKSYPLLQMDVDDCALLRKSLLILIDLLRFFEPVFISTNLSSVLAKKHEKEDTFKEKTYLPFS